MYSEGSFAWRPVMLTGNVSVRAHVDPQCLEEFITATHEKVHTSNEKHILCKYAEMKLDFETSETCFILTSVCQQQPGNFCRKQHSFFSFQFAVKERISWIIYATFAISLWNLCNSVEDSESNRSIPPEVLRSICWIMHATASGGRLLIHGVRLEITVNQVTFPFMKN